MSSEQRIKELINNLSAIEAPGYDDPRDARMNVGKFHQKAREELLQIGAPAVPFLIEYSQDAKIRDLIKEIGDSAIEPLLAHLQEDPNSPYLEFVIRSLGLLNSVDASDLILKYLQTSEDTEVRTQAAIALGLIQKNREHIDVSPMFNLLDDLLAAARIQPDGQYEFASFTDSRRCEEVIVAIGTAGDERATERLITMLGKTKDILKLRIVQALGNIGDERAVGPIIENIESGKELSDLMTKELVRFKDPQGKEFAKKFIQENPSLRYTQQIKDELAKDKATPVRKPEILTVSTNHELLNVKGLYVMVFAPEKQEAEKLKEITEVADRMLREKDLNFKQLIEQQMASNTKMNITGVQYAPLMHTPQSMQTTLMGWLKKAHNVEFKPLLGKTFFPHGMKQPDGNETFIFFYFDMGDGKSSEPAQPNVTKTTPEKTDQEASAPKKQSKTIIIALAVGVLVLCICGAVACLVFPYLTSN